MSSRSSALITRLDQLVRESAAPSKQGRRTRAERLASVLSWRETEKLSVQIPGSPAETPVIKALLGSQPAVIFFNAGNADAELQGAALFAYHCSVEWSLIATRDHLTIINSHWIRKGQWFALPAMKWGQLNNYFDILEGLTPDGLSYGRIELVANRFAQPDTFLKPVDDALVDRLDYWRAEAARFSTDIAAIDERLHKTFAQLFVLRAVEDRRLTTAVPALTTALTAHGLDQHQVQKIFRAAEKELQTELFNGSEITNIPEAVAHGIITDLYFPRNLPVPNARYNFAWIDADILGRAYEKYLSTVLTPVQQRPQLELLGQPLQEFERIPARKSAGIYYTPQYLVHHLTTQCIDQVVAQLPDFPNRLPKIVDLSCGSGSFLTTSVTHLIRKLRTVDRAKNWGKEIVRQKCIIGIDRDPRAVMLARLSLWLRLAEEPNPLPLPKLDALIVQGDSLDEDSWKSLPRQYDVAVGNPPFMPIGQVPSRQELVKRFKSAVGRFDYSYVFIELALQRLKDGGMLGMVAPNRLFRNRDASAVRHEITTQCTLLCITDFGSTEVFRGTNAYIGTIVARKVGGQQGAEVRYVRVLKLPERFAGFLLDLASSSDLSTDFVRSFLNRQPVGSDPWLFLSPATMSARLRLQDQSEQLDSIAGLYQGIKAGANDIFILEVEEITGALASARNGLGDRAVLELDLLRPVVYGADIQPYLQPKPTKFLIYPYDVGELFSEEVLESKFPRTWAYLNRYKDFLSSRTSLITGGKGWYQLVRPRDEEWLSSPKLMIRDLATETAFGVDLDGSMYLVGGTAIVPSDPSLLLPLLAYLNSRLVNWYLNPVMSAFRSDFQKFEPQHLQRIPVLRTILEDSQVSDHLARFASEAITLKAEGMDTKLASLQKEIDTFLCTRIGIDPTELF